MCLTYFTHNNIRVTCKNKNIKSTKNLHISILALNTERLFNKPSAKLRADKIKQIYFRFYNL